MVNQTEQQKYEKYFFRNAVTGSMKEEWGGEMIGLGGIKSDVIPADAHMSLGVTAVRKPYMFHEPLHKHMFTEYFYFFGSNPYDMDEFDARVEYTFGPEREKHIITSPSIVTATPGVYHCPLNYAEINKPIYCLEAFMTKGYSGVDFGEDLLEIRTDEHSYDRYFTKGVVRYDQWGGQKIGLNTVPEHVLPAGAKLNLDISVVRKPYMYHDAIHKHNFTEFYFFFGSNPMDMKEFDAEVEFYFGTEKEKYLISGPTIVVVPPGVFHFPLNFKKINKPIYFLEVSMTSRYRATDL
jgi:mannose-6-phosphate isomerase-like protein (cupin superfamily)